MSDSDTIGIELLHQIIRHRRAIVLCAMMAVSATAWAYLLLDPGQVMGQRPSWDLPYAVMILVMWVVMMAAMMLPTAAPTVLLVTAIAGDRLDNSDLVPATAMLFTAGYLLVWCGFGVVATLLQWGLDKAGLLSETMAFANAISANTVFIAAGVYQWTPLKDTCLRHCRSPTKFLLRHWQKGMLRAVRTGVRHGLFCLGCCWMLMALMFVGGLMNVAWIGVIALLVLFEKTIPWGDSAGRFVGLMLIGWGTVDLIRIAMA